MLPCVHIGKPIGQTTSPAGEETQYACAHPKHPETTPSACLTCPDFLGRPTLAPSRVMPLSALTGQKATNGQAHASEAPRHPIGVVVNHRGIEVDLGDFYRGATAFAVQGGPSCQELPMHLLGRRGCLIFSTNNCPGNLPIVEGVPIRPHVWLHTDSPQKFHDSLWSDPGILKFAPVREWDSYCREARPTVKPNQKHPPKGLRRRASDGVLEFIPDTRPRDMPSTFGYHRNTCFNPETFLWEPQFNRGNDKNSLGNGWPHTINSFLTMLRVAFYLGVKRLYLVGADFEMREDVQYGFGQTKWSGGVASNNNAYTNLCVMCDALKPHFAAAGFEVLNTNPKSHLWTFEFADFTEAVMEATAGFEQKMRLDDWYNPPGEKHGE